MINRILKILKDQCISKYLIKQEIEECSELFFIKDKLDMPRFKELETIYLTIYVDSVYEQKHCMGEASIKITPDMTDEEMDSKIWEAKKSCLLLHNKPFELADGVTGFATKLIDETTSKVSKNIAKRMLSVLVDDAFLNSFEIFVKKISTKIINSNGLNVSFNEFIVNGEFIVQSKKEEDVELYKQFYYNDPIAYGLENYIKESLENVILRSLAKRVLTSSNMNVLIKGRDVAEIFEFFHDRLDSNFIYNGYSDFKEGLDSGFDLDISTQVTIPYSSDGITLKEMPLLKKGIIQNILGNVKFSRYLGKTPNGRYSKLYVKEGDFDTGNIEGDYLELLEFSDFQMDSFTGQFSGEIRLGILHKDNTETIVTGGSISGNLFENKFKLSKDRQNFNRLNGPKAILFENVNISEA